MSVLLCVDGVLSWLGQGRRRDNPRSKRDAKGSFTLGSTMGMFRCALWKMQYGDDTFLKAVNDLSRSSVRIKECLPPKQHYLSASGSVLHSSTYNAGLLGISNG